MNKKELTLKVKKSLEELKIKSNQSDDLSGYFQFIETLFIELLPCFPTVTLEYIHKKSEGNKRLK